MTTPAELAGIHRRLPKNRALGLDEVNLILLRNFSRKTVVQVAYIANAVLKLQHRPIQWKEVILVSNPKPGKNYSLPDRLPREWS